MSDKKNSVAIESWNYDETDKNRPVHLKYADGSELLVQKSVFDRAFGTIVGVDKDTCMEEFAIPDVQCAMLLCLPKEGVTLEELAALSYKIGPDGVYETIEAVSQTGKYHALGLIRRETLDQADKASLERAISATLDALSLDVDKKRVRTYTDPETSISIRVWLGTDVDLR